MSSNEVVKNDKTNPLFRKVNVFAVYLAIGANMLSVVLFGVAGIVLLDPSRVGLLLGILANLAIVNGALAWGASRPSGPEPDSPAQRNGV